MIALCSFSQLQQQTIWELLRIVTVCESANHHLSIIIICACGDEICSVTPAGQVHWSSKYKNCQAEIWGWRLWYDLVDVLFLILRMLSFPHGPKTQIVTIISAYSQWSFRWLTGKFTKSQEESVISCHVNLLLVVWASSHTQIRQSHVLPISIHHP